MTTTILQRLHAGRLARMMQLTGLANPRLVEVAGIVGELDGVWLDLDERAISHSQLEMVLTACRAVELEALVRVGPGDAAAIAQPLEAGCGGVMVGRVRALAEVELAAATVREAQGAGRKLLSVGVAGGEGGVAVQSAAATAERDHWLAIEIDSPESLELVDEIATVEGVDTLMVRTTELATALGEPNADACRAAFERVAAACRAAGKPWGARCSDPATARACRAMGAQWFCHLSDLECFRAGLRTLEERFDGILDAH